MGLLQRAHNYYWGCCIFLQVDRNWWTTGPFSSRLVFHVPSPMSDQYFSPLFFFPVDCLDPTCSSHGVCVNGECLCSPGWGGLNCELARVQCPDQCSGHGTYLPDTGLCSCDPNWMGPDCSVGKSRGFLLASPNTHTLYSFHEPTQMGINSLYLAPEGGTLVSCIVPLLLCSQPWRLWSLRNIQTNPT